VASARNLLSLKWRWRNSGHDRETLRCRSNQVVGKQAISPESGQAPSQAKNGFAPSKALNLMAFTVYIERHHAAFLSRTLRYQTLLGRSIHWPTAFWDLAELHLAWRTSLARL
jgi:hypothetical protein